MITVKVAQMGRVTVEVTLENGATVAEALEAAERDLPEGYAAQVGTTKDVPVSTTLNDGDIVVIYKGAKGNS